MDLPNFFHQIRDQKDCFNMKDGTVNCGQAHNLVLRFWDHLNVNVNEADTSEELERNFSQNSLFSGVPNQEFPKILSSLLASNVCWAWAVCKLTVLCWTPRTLYIYQVCFKTCPLLSSSEVSRRPRSPQCINEGVRIHKGSCSTCQALCQASYTHSLI